MRQVNVLFKLSWTFLVAIFLTFGLAGCEGDDGANGAAGAAGAAGPAGPAGPAGNDGNDGADGADGADGVANVTPLESCGVCHSDGSFASAPAAHEVFDIGSFDDFEVIPDTAVATDLIISFSVTVDGAPATGAALGTVYVADGMGGRRSTSSREDPADRLTASFEPGSGTDGNYSVRLVDGVTLFGDTNSRYLAIVEVGANELEIAAVGDYPAPIPLAGLASNESCIGCHGASGEVGRFAPTRRGGHYSAPMSVDACVVCHRTDNPATPDDEEPSYMRIARVVHGIHNSHNFPDGEFVTDRDNSYNITYPTYMTNCSVCHSDDNELPATGGSALAAANAMPVSGEGCFTCHGSMASFDFTGSFSHTGYDETTNCGLCHGDNPETEAVEVGIAPATVAAMHNGATTGRGGIIWDGVDTSVAEGALFDWQITDVVDDGVDLAISWTASYKGTPVDPCNDTATADNPVFFLGANVEELSMYRSYAQGDDFIIGTSTSAPGQAGSVDLTDGNTTCVGLIATTTLPVDAVDAEKGRLALGGKPLVLSSLIDPATIVEARVPTPTYDWLLGDGGPAVERRAVVDTGKCLNCHEGSLYQHGGDRVDNVAMCLVCHNSASNEKNRRVAMGVDASEAYDGKTGETFEMKTMLHRVHSAATEDSPPYVIYRSRGIYAFAPDVSDVPNWDVISTEGCDEGEIARGERLVFGGDPESSSSCQPHNFHSATYPRALNACTACHTEDFMVIPDQTEAMATTTEAGSEEWANQLDDTLQGAATTACVTCHKDGAAKGHAYQNSWTPQVFPEGRQTIIDAVN